MATLATDQPAALELLPTFADVVVAADREEASCVGVDMPIGLPANGPRTSDFEARALLGARRSSLFPTPVAAVLDASDYTEACAVSRRLTGKAISKQMWHLLPMVRQIRAALGPDQRERFVEAHPESTFVQLVGRPLDSKKSAAGVGQRIQALRPHVTGLDDVLASAPAGCAVDDALDALAAAVTAQRFVAGEATIFGSGHDAAGYPLCIVA
jgi:predicted RNase H-like nuclease